MVRFAKLMLNVGQRRNKELASIGQLVSLPRKIPGDFVRSHAISISVNEDVCIVALLQKEVCDSARHRDVTHSVKRLEHLFVPHKAVRFQDGSQSISLAVLRKRNDPTPVPSKKLITIQSAEIEQN
jgi:hypothetical protein